MKDLKANFKYIIYLIVFTALLVLSIINFQAVRSFLATIVSVLTPFIAGFCIAFAVNELLKPLEKLWGKIFTKEAQGGIRKKGSRPLSQKLKRPICLILSLLIVLSAVFAIILVIIPRFAETVSSFAGSLPSYAAKTESWYNSVCEWFARHEITLPHPQIDLDNRVLTSSIPPSRLPPPFFLSLSTFSFPLFLLSISWPAKKSSAISSTVLPTPI